MDNVARMEATRVVMNKVEVSEGLHTAHGVRCVDTLLRQGVLGTPTEAEALEVLCNALMITKEDFVAILGSGVAGLIYTIENACETSTLVNSRFA